MQNAHMSFEVPPGTQLLAFSVGADSLEHLRFIFGGKQRAFRITRIRELRCDHPNLFFTDATPHEVTVFFAQNSPVNASSGDFYIEVNNQSASVETLLLTAMYEVGPGRVCAL